MVRKWNANTMIVSDVPVSFAMPRQKRLSRQRNMTFVGTFADDEPLSQFLKAAGRFREIGFYVTGRLKKKNQHFVKEAPANVTFTDFLDDPDYVGLLVASDAIICLTTRAHTMQRGAYEGVYLGKPIITSSFEILRKTFTRGTVHVTADVDDIANGIQEMIENLDKYRQEVAQLREQKLKSWTDVANNLNRVLGRNRVHSTAPEITSQILS